MTTGPTEEFVESTLSLSREFLDDSVANLEQGRLRTSAGRAYYSIHYGAIALLARRGIRPPRSHRGLVNVFGSEIVNQGAMGPEFSTMLSNALHSRAISTYAPDASIAETDAQATVDDARRFLAAVQSILNY